jgi:hypothetical protein
MSQRASTLAVGMVCLRVPTNKIVLNVTHAHDSLKNAIIHYAVVITAIVRYMKDLYNSCATNPETIGNKLCRLVWSDFY